MLTREQLVALRTTRTVAVGGDSVTIRMLSSGDICEFLFRIKDAGDDKRAQLAAMRHLVGCSLVDAATGTRMYPPGAEQETSEIEPDAFDAIRDAALKLNAVAKEESDAAGKG